VNRDKAIKLYEKVPYKTDFKYNPKLRDNEPCMVKIENKIKDEKEKIRHNEPSK
jgi:hypothetical protein